MLTRRSLPISAAFITAILASSSFSFADEIVWNVVTDKGVDRGNATAGVNNAIGDARTYLASHPDDTLVLYFPGGTEYIFDSGGKRAIVIGNFTSGNLVLRGDGPSSTILQFNRYDQQGIRILDSNRITVEQMHLTRDKHYVSQGDVVSVVQGIVTFQVHQGFPDPQWLSENSVYHADGDLAQRTLLGFRGPDLDPELDPSYPKVLLDDVTCDSAGLCTALLQHHNEIPPWQPGQRVAFRSKVGEPTIFVTNSDDVIVQNVRFTRMSLVAIRFSNGCDGPILRRVRVDRSDDVINGRVPFYSAPAGGPQIDTATRGPTIQDCTIVGTGDDGIAVFTDDNATTPTSGTLIEGNTVRDNHGRGILLNGGDGSINGNICRNNTLIRNANASILVGQVSNDWDIYQNTFIQSWLAPAIRLDGSNAAPHENIRIFSNWFYEAPKNNNLILVDKTNNLEIYNNTIFSFSTEEDYNSLGTGNALVYVVAGNDVQGWGNTYPPGTLRPTTIQERPTDNVHVEWSAHAPLTPTVVPVAEDSYVNSNAPDSAYGAIDSMKAQQGANRTLLGLVKFHLNSVVPEGTMVLSAKLKVPVQSSSFPAVDPQVYASSDNGWSESTVTFNNKPAIGELIESKLGTFPAGTSVEFDVTNKVMADGIYSFYLWNGTNDVGTYATKENTTYGGATLEITTFMPGDHAPAFINEFYAQDNVMNDVPYLASLAREVYDVDGDIYNSSGDMTGFSKMAGPEWLSVSADGLLSGTPSSTDAGENIFVVRITDANGNYAEATLSISVVGTAMWTPWLNRDNPGGLGDYETVSDFLSGQVCANPLGIECQTTSGVNWNQTGEVYSCTPSTGGVCVNANQPDGICLDYRVRFLCP